MHSKQKYTFVNMKMSVLLASLLLAACASETTTHKPEGLVCADGSSARGPAANSCEHILSGHDSLVQGSKGEKSKDEKQKTEKPTDESAKINQLKIDDGHVTVINMKGKALESPMVSPDGGTILAISDLAGKAPVDIIVKNLKDPRDTGTKLGKPLMNLFIKGAFVGSADQIVACELEFRASSLPKTVINYLKTKEWDPIGYHSVISFYKNGKRVSALDARAFGLPDKTFLEHPRVSPDQKWLTFYVQPGAEMPSPATQGIYLYNFETKTTTYLGNHADKHPTWSADGQQIFFHEQGKMGNTEIARVGFYDLEFSGNDVRVKNRAFFTDPGQTLGTDYVYQKHPAYHAGLRLVLFHERVGEGCAENPEACKKAIGVISMDHPERPPLFLKLSYNGKKVSHVQHVDVSDQPDSPLYFVGRVDGEQNDRLLQLDYSALQQAQAALLNP